MQKQQNFNASVIFGETPFVYRLRANRDLRVCRIDSFSLNLNQRVKNKSKNLKTSLFDKLEVWRLKKKRFIFRIW